MNKRYSIIILILCTFLIIGLVGCHNNKSEDRKDTSTHIEKAEEIETKRPQTENVKLKDEEKQIVDPKEVTYFITDEDFKKYERQGLNPFGQDIKQEDLTFIDYIYYIHGMSHQKVKADEKWAFFEIHPKRIDWLLEQLNKSEIKYNSIFKDVLEKWKAGNFSEVDKDHNNIWEIQNGTIGKATRILTSEEELQFLENEYEKMID